MVDIPMNAREAIDRNSLLSVNASRVEAPFTSQNIQTVNTRKTSRMPSAGRAPAPNATTSSTSAGHPTPPLQQMPRQPLPLQQSIPHLLHPVQKGQKIPLSAGQPISRIKACLGWNTSNHQCDVDVSAFLLDGSGKVPGDSWFVFYGQTTSPDASTSFEVDGTSDREIIHIDFTRLNPSVKKIVFVLTIDEAFQKKLHFGMLKDAYVRILNEADGTELVSFPMTDYYSNVISMMIGEVYQHNGIWKFHAIGDGVARDLAGLCELYGVQVSS